MKAKMQALSHDRDGILPYEQYIFNAHQDGPEGRIIKVEIQGSVWKNPLFTENQKYSDFEIEITITEKPKTVVLK